jgi:protein involved in ribonucleotide reduction
MRKSAFLIPVILMILSVLAACQNSASGDPRTFAQKLMHDAGQDTAKITNVVSGDKKYRRADELWCIATDASSQDGQVPYLLAVWRTGDKWDGTELAQGYYEWDLYGCPR